MGSLFRSEEMCLAQFYFQSEAAFSCVSELGELGMVQFRDLNAGVNAFQRKFVNEVRRCDEMERKLRFLEKELKRDNILIDDDGENPSAPLPKEMNDLEARFEKLESDIKEVNANEDTLKKNFQELTELKHILRKAQYFFDEAITHHEQQEGASSPRADEMSQSLLGQDYSQDHRLRLGFVAGVIPMEKLGPFERVLWRACRGNVFLRYEEIETSFKDWKTDEEVHKCVFIIFFQGDQLKNRVRSICEGFHANLYPCPDSAQERREVAIGVMTRLEDLQAVLTQTSEHRRTLLSQVAMNIRVWFIKIRKIKAIYATLNMFNVNTTDKCLIAEGWCPLMDLDQIRGALRHGTNISGSTVPSILQQMKTNKTPPTYNRNNAFTSGFQGIIDAFGICTYLEVNPAPFTIVTFPFLFGVMFGDLGHGLIMFLFALYLVLNERRFSMIKTDNDIWIMTFGGRYLILLMGAFSMYTGFLYNECFSRSLNLFGSAWNVSAQPGLDMQYLGNEHHEVVTFDPMKANVARGRSWVNETYMLVDGQNVSVFETCNSIPYLYGFDPIWLTAENKITFSNSYKMKSAVLLGMVQMLFGLALSYVNLKYFKKKLEFYCEWIPQMIFISCMIGYLCICILIKWATVRDPHRAPSLLIGLIDMFMLKQPDPVHFQLLFPGQGAVQYLLVFCALAAVPWMLLAKPYILYQRHKKPVSAADTRYESIQLNVDDDDSSIIHHDQLGATNDMMSDDDDDVGHSHGGHGDEEFDMTEIMIHQTIHTIEFCLNCISHTASYLRLWALSLAHSELSEVLWGMVMHVGLSTRGTLGAVMTFFIFWMFSSLTVGILLLMEGLSAFLHALRLHWVEFQSKFFQGEGVAFEPLTFTHIVDGKDD